MRLLVQAVFASLLVVGVLVGVNGAGVLEGKCINTSAENFNVTVDYTTSATNLATTFSFVVSYSSPPGVANFAIRLADALANHSERVYASPVGALQQGFSAKGGPQYIWNFFSENSTQTFQLTVYSLPGSPSQILRLSEVTQQGISINGTSSPAGTSIVFLELKDGQCGYLALEDNPKAALAPGPSGRLPRTLFGVGAPVVAPLASAGRRLHVATTSPPGTYGPPSYPPAYYYSPTSPLPTPYGYYSSPSLLSPYVQTKSAPAGPTSGSLNFPGSGSAPLIFPTSVYTGYYSSPPAYGYYTSSPPAYGYAAAPPSGRRRLLADLPKQEDPHLMVPLELSRPAALFGKVIEMEKADIVTKRVDIGSSPEGYNVLDPSMLSLPICIDASEHGEPQCMDEGVCGGCFAKQMSDDTGIEITVDRAVDPMADTTVFSIRLRTNGSNVPSTFSVRVADKLIMEKIYPTEVVPTPILDADKQPYFVACDSNGLQNTIKWRNFQFVNGLAIFTVAFEGIGVDLFETELYVISGEGRPVVLTPADAAVFTVKTFKNKCMWEAVPY